MLELQKTTKLRLSKETLCLLGGPVTGEIRTTSGLTCPPDECTSGPCTTDPVAAFSPPARPGG